MKDQSQPHKPIDLVIASAGTGKTTRLVRELQQAIERIGATTSVMATTFTNKAADELLERTRKNLIADGKANQAAGLLGARVGTVNATLGKIVGEFALNLGRSPVADVISEQHQARLFSIAAEAAIARHAPEMIPIAQRLEIENWQADVQQLATLVRRNNIAPDELEEHAKSSWRGLRTILPEAAEEAAHMLDTRLRKALDDAKNALEAEGDASGITTKVKERVAEVRGLLASGRELSWRGWAQLSKLKPGKASIPLVGPVVALAGKHAAHPRLHTDLRSYIEGVYRATKESLTLYRQYKDIHGLIDFIDQEQLALQLLDDPDISDTLGETLSSVFVDEFQDTSPIQLELFLKLSQIAERSFWVGDPKQAIYGFRDTDPELIARVAEEVVTTSGGLEETLDTSYRARPGLIELTNRIFSPAFEALGFEPRTTQIAECYRRDGSGQTEPVEIWSLSGKTIPLAIRSLATQVRQVLNKAEDYPIEDKSTKSMRAIRGSDIAILCRTNSRCDNVARALAEAGVSVSIARTGLLGTAEAALAVAALRYLVDPNDGLAIAEIAHLIEDAEGQPTWLERSLSDGGIRSLCAEIPTLVALDDARDQLAYLTPREALEIAMTTSGVSDRVRQWGRALDRIANLNALRGLAAQYEDEATAIRSAATAAGLVAWLANLDESESRQPASADPTAVNVITYHSAKGLEWPMAVLFDLDYARVPSAFQFHVETREHFNVWRPLSGRWVRFWPWPYGQQRKGVYIDSSVVDTDEYRKVERREQAEAVRLLYVGMTRARDYLVLGLRNYDKEAVKATWLNQLLDHENRPIVDLTQLQSAQVLGVAGESLPISFVLVGAGEDLEDTEEQEVSYQVPEAQQKSEFPPYRISPSKADSALSDAFHLVTRIELGTRIPIFGNPNMELLGEAIHSFLAADRPDQILAERKRRAIETLARWQVTALGPEQLIEMSNRLFAHLRASYPDMSIHAEVPVFGKRNGQRLRGQVDLLLQNRARAVVIDHKSYPGAFDTWEERALSYGAQLALYSSTVGLATGINEIETWVHLPILGQLIQVQSAAASGQISNQLA